MKKRRELAFDPETLIAVKWLFKKRVSLEGPRDSSSERSTFKAGLQPAPGKVDF